MLAVSQAYLVPAGCSRHLFSTLRYKLEWPGEPFFLRFSSTSLPYIHNLNGMDLPGYPRLSRAFLGFVGFLSNLRGLPSPSSQVSLLVFWYPPTLFELDFISSCSSEKFNSWSRDLCRAQLGLVLNFGLPSPTSCAVFFRFNTTGTLFISPVR